MLDEVKWLLVGDFNLYRSPIDRNKPVGDHTKMYLFNEAISALGLVELPLKGRRFTWSNKQLNSLLERLDWFFTSISWTFAYPNSFASTLVMETSDHAPCVITISTYIPKRSSFKFKSFWMEH
jgi:exonuclease III